MITALWKFDVLKTKKPSPRNILVLRTLSFQGTTIRSIVLKDKGHLYEKIKPRLLGPVRTTRNFVCFGKKSVNAKRFLVRTIFG